jgi:hypothetical protein
MTRILTTCNDLQQLKVHLNNEHLIVLSSFSLHFSTPHSSLLFSTVLLQRKSKGNTKTNAGLSEKKKKKTTTT